MPLGPRWVAYILGLAYAGAAMIWPPVPGARHGAMLGAAALTIIFWINWARSGQGWRY